MRWLVALALCWSMGAWGADYYACPKGVNSGTSDGAAIGTCFDGTQDITGISAGDTVYMCTTGDQVFGGATYGENYDEDGAGALTETVTFAPQAGGSSGNLITYDGDCSAQTGYHSRAVVRESTGNTRVFSTGSSGASLRGYVHLKNIDFEFPSVALLATGFPAAVLIMRSPAITSAQTELGYRLTDVTVTGPDVYVDGVTVKTSCLRLRGNDNVLTRVTLRNCPTDGLLYEGSNNTFTDLDIRNVDMQTDTDAGDCVQQLGGSGANYESGGNRFVRPYCETPTTTNGKHGMIFSGRTDAVTATPNVVEGAKVYGGVFGISASNTNLIVRRSYIRPANVDSGAVFNVTGTASATQSYTRFQAYSNLGDCATNGGCRTGLSVRFAQSEYVTAIGNVFSMVDTTYGVVPTRGLWIQAIAAFEGTPTLTWQNNIVSGPRQGTRIDEAGYTYVGGTNNYYAIGSGGLHSGSSVTDLTATGDITSDPAWVGGDEPATAEEFRPNAWSSVCGAGTYIAGTRDYDDLPMGYPADIGAFRCPGGDSPAPSFDLGGIFSWLIGLAGLLGIGHMMREQLRTA